MRITLATVMHLRQERPLVDALAIVKRNELVDRRGVSPDSAARGPEAGGRRETPRWSPVNGGGYPSSQSALQRLLHKA